jgi:hypothetical protein
LNSDVLYRLTFQNRFSVDLKHFSALKRLIARTLDFEIAWRPWFIVRGAACNAPVHRYSKDQPRVCSTLDAHSHIGVASLQAFNDDFSYMTPLQTLMLASDPQACR